MRWWTISLDGVEVLCIKSCSKIDACFSAVFKLRLYNIDFETIHAEEIIK